MPEPGLISGLPGTPCPAQLPAPVVEELADGLERNLPALPAAWAWPPTPRPQSAVAEFGDPQVIAAAFARANPARRAARRLLAIGPVVGGVLGGGADHQPGLDLAGPVPAALLPGLALWPSSPCSPFAALSTRYRPVARAGAAGCIGTAALDPS